MFKFPRVIEDHEDDAKVDPENWEADEVLDGKLFRYLDTGVDSPLIEIREADLPRLEGYEYYEPYWVIVAPPLRFAIFDRKDRLLYGPRGFFEGYDLNQLLEDEGYESFEHFREVHAATISGEHVSDLDVWVRLGLPAKVFLPSLKKKGS